MELQSLVVPRVPFKLAEVSPACEQIWQNLEMIGITGKAPRIHMSSTTTETTRRFQLSQLSQLLQHFGNYALGTLYQVIVTKNLEKLGKLGKLGKLESSSRSTHVITAMQTTRRSQLS